MVVAAIFGVAIFHHSERAILRVLCHPIIDASVFDCESDYRVGSDIVNSLPPKVDGPAVSKRLFVLICASQPHGTQPRWPTVNWRAIIEGRLPTVQCFDSTIRELCAPSDAESAGPPKAALAIGKALRDYLGVEPSTPSSFPPRWHCPRCNNAQLNRRL